MLVLLYENKHIVCRSNRSSFFIESTTYVFMFPRLAAELKISSKILSLAELVNEVDKFTG